MEHRIAVDDVIYTAFHERPSTSPQETKGLVLLVHALMSNQHMWSSTVTALVGAGYETLTFDHIGHNLTTAPSDLRKRFHLDDITRHANSIVKRVKGNDTRLAAIVGCSIGGVLALRYAMLFPGDVDAVISLCAPGTTSLEASRSLWSERIELFRQDEEAGTDQLCRKTVDRWIPGQTERDEMTRTQALSHVKTCSLRGYEILADTIRNYDYERELAITSWPRCLIMGGSEDGAAPPDVIEEIAQKVKGSELVILQGCGHLPPMQRDQEFERELMRFLQK